MPGHSGGTTAILITNGIGSVTNTGFISGGHAQSGNGVQLDAGGSVKQQGRGIYTNGGDAVYSYAGVSSGFVTNTGRITANGSHGSAGVYLRGNYTLNTAGGNVDNNAGGSISAMSASASPTAATSRISAASTAAERRAS